MLKKNIPNLFTLGNLSCGCVAVVLALNGNLIWSAYLVGIAGLFDFFDGMVARLLKVTSEIGKQLDSLADMVSFGLVPGVILFELLNRAFDKHSSIDVRVIIPLSFLGFLITLFSAIRLAKFNIDTRQTHSFIGVPTPAVTIFIASLPLIVYEGSSASVLVNLIRNPYFLLGITIIFSFLLVAPIPLFALKFKNFSWQDNKLRFIFLATAILLLVIFKYTGISLIILLYIILSTLSYLFTKNLR